MPLTLTPVTHGKLCHGVRWVIADEDDLARKVAHLALGQSRHVAAILANIDKKAPATRADTAKEAIKLLICGIGWSSSRPKNGLRRRRTWNTPRQA